MPAADLISACKGVGDLDLGPENQQRLTVAVEESMPRHYAIPFPLAMRDTFDREGHSTRVRRGQWHELVQHLTDLAYLSLQNFQDWHAQRERDEIPRGPTMASVLFAVGQFVTEDDYPGYALLPQLSKSNALEWTEQQLSLLVHRLSVYVSFDGELAIRTNYRIGEKSCYGRSLAYRIRVYYHDFVDRRTSKRKEYFDADLVPFLHSLDNCLKGSIRNFLPGPDEDRLHPRVQEMLIDYQTLFAEFRSRNRFHPNERGDYFLVYDIRDTEEERQLDLPENKREERRMRRLQRRARQRLKDDELHIDTGQNRLGVRLLQIGLWRAGFYVGALDGAFGEMSHEAIMRLVDQELERNQWIKDQRGTVRRRDRPDKVLRDGQLRKIQVSVPADTDTLWIIDLKLIGELLDAYQPGSEAETEESEEEIIEAIRAAGEEARLDREYVERQREVAPAYGDIKHHPERRVYFGLRGLVKGAFRAIGRVVKWIAGAVKKIFGAVFDFVKAIAKRLQEGISLFFEGFRYFGHYLLGRPFVSLGEAREGHQAVMSTSFRVDFDSAAFVSSRASADDMRGHIEYLAKMREGIAYFLDTTIDIINFIRTLQPPLGWIRMGIYIARKVRDLLRSGDFSRQAV